LGIARFELSLRLLKRAQRKVEAAGFDQQTLGPVDLSRLLPILEFGSIATDESLQDRWASLLANALVDPEGVPPSYPEILRQLTPAEVAILDGIYEEAGSTWPTSAYEPQLMAERAGFTDAGERVILSTQNLLRLYLVKSKALVFPGATQEESKVHLTHLGHDFVSVCRPPTARE
jgi:Abortive infection alpha